MGIREITGTITLNDGTTSEFLITPDVGWQQWGANAKRLGQSVDAVEAMASGLAAEGAFSIDEEDES